MRHPYAKTVWALVYVFLSLCIVFPGCSLHKQENAQAGEYKDLIKSYNKDLEYKKGLEDLKNNLQQGSESIPVNQQPGLSMMKNLLKNKGSLKDIPILTYHCIDDTIFGVREMFVSPGAFDEQMKYIKEQGYTPITFEDLDKIDSIDKPIMITLDDGYEDNYLYAYPILKKYHFKATIFLIVNAINKPKYLKMEEISQMKDLIDFQSHTLSHPHLADLDEGKILFELAQSKRGLESLLKKKVSVIAYPYGSYNQKVIEIAKRYYRFGVTTHFGKFYVGAEDNYQIKRMSVLDHTQFSSFEQFFK